MTLLGLLLAVAAAGALGLAVLAAPGAGFDLGLIGLSIVGALLAGIVLSMDRRRLREHDETTPPRHPPPAGDDARHPRHEVVPEPPTPDHRRAAEWSPAPTSPAADGGGDSVRVAWALADEPGITPELRHDLLAHFGSWRALRAASVEELEEAPGVGYSLARRIRAALDR